MNAFWCLSIMFSARFSSCGWAHSHLWRSIVALQPFVNSVALAPSPPPDVLLRFYEQKSISGYMMRLLESISRTKQLLVVTRKTSARHQRLGLIRKWYRKRASENYMFAPSFFLLFLLHNLQIKCVCRRLHDSHTHSFPFPFPWLRRTKMEGKKGISCLKSAVCSFDR